MLLKGASLEVSACDGTVRQVTAMGELYQPGRVVPGLTSSVFASGMPRNVWALMVASRLHSEGINLLYSRQIEKSSGLAQMLVHGRFVADTAWHAPALRCAASVADDTRAPITA
jgi:hypothetical protein